MKKTLLFFVFAFSFLTVFPQSIDKNSKDIDNLKYEIEIIKRDQNNYEIEKNLLRETFSSNYQTVNIIVTIILGVFSVIGFLGLRSIGSINKEYQNELRDLKKLKLELEEKIAETITEQRRLTSKYSEIDQVNEEQTKKIKILELLEKAGSYMNHHDFSTSLNYLNLAVEIDKTNIPALRQRSYCYWQMDNYSDAIKDLEEILNLDANDKGSKANLLELYLITAQKNKYDKYIENYFVALSEKENSSVLKYYFKIFRKYINGDDIRMEVESYANQIQDNENKRRVDWGFDDVQRYLRHQEKNKNTLIFSMFVKLIIGNINKEQFFNAIKDENILTTAST